MSNMSRVLLLQLSIDISVYTNVMCKQAGVTSRYIVQGGPIKRAVCGLGNVDYSM